MLSQVRRHRLSLTMTLTDSKVVVGRSSGLVLLLLSVVLSPLNSEVLIDLALRTYIADVTTGDRRSAHRLERSQRH